MSKFNILFFIQIQFICISEPGKASTASQEQIHSSVTGKLLKQK